MFPTNIVKFLTKNIFKVGCLHPVACTRSGSGFPSNATLVWIFNFVYREYIMGERGSVVVKALGYKPEGRWFETRWGEIFKKNYLILAAALGPGVYCPSSCRMSTSFIFPFLQVAMHTVSNKYENLLFNTILFNVFPSWAIYNWNCICQK
jgi:hypothetical protein